MKLPLLDPELMVMLAGVGSTLELLDRLIVAGLVAALVKATVQTAAWPVPSALGAQLRLDSRGAATRLTEAVIDTPFAVAVSTAV